MIDLFPCPVPGCSHSQPHRLQHFRSKSTLLRHLNHEDHHHTFHLADQTTCQSINIYSCCHTSCPTAPTRFFRSLEDLTNHNSIHHPPPQPLPYLQNTTPPHPPSHFTLSTNHFFSNALDGSHNLWHHGIPFILSHTTHHPPDFRSTWRRHLTKRNKSNFLRL